MNPLASLVSIIMPAYNAGNYLAESIESILAQTYLNWELIIIDDGSTDQTKKVVTPFVIRDERILYIYQENGKQGKARNNGIRNSKGSLIAFLDADDLWHPEKLERQVICMNEVQADLIFSDCYSFTDDIHRELNSFHTVTGYIYEEQGFELFLKQNRIPILTVLVKKESLLKVECFDEKKSIQNAEDYQLWLKLLVANCTFYGMADVLAYYRIHSSQSTTNDPISTLQAIYAIQSINNLPPSFKKLKKRNMKVWMRRLFRIAPPTEKEKLAEVIKLYHGGDGFAVFVYFYYFLIKISGVKLSKKIFLRLLNYSWI